MPITFSVLPPAVVTDKPDNQTKLYKKGYAAALNDKLRGTIVDASGATLAAVATGSTTLGILEQSTTTAFAKQGGLGQGVYNYDRPPQVYYKLLGIGDKLVMSFKGTLSAADIGAAYGTDGTSVDPAVTTSTRKFRILEVANGAVGDTNPRVLVQVE